MTSTTGATMPRIAKFTNVSVYKSKSIFAPVISDTGNNFLLNEPIIDGIKNPYGSVFFLLLCVEKIPIFQGYWR